MPLHLEKRCLRIQVSSWWIFFPLMSLQCPPSILINFVLKPILFYNITVNLLLGYICLEILFSALYSEIISTLNFEVCFLYAGKGCFIHSVSLFIYPIDIKRYSWQMIVISVILLFWVMVAVMCLGSGVCMYLLSLGFLV